MVDAVEPTNAEHTPQQINTADIDRLAALALQAVPKPGNPNRTPESVLKKFLPGDLLAD